MFYNIFSVHLQELFDQLFMFNIFFYIDALTFRLKYGFNISPLIYFNVWINQVATPT